MRTVFSSLSLAAALAACSPASPPGPRATPSAAPAPAPAAPAPSPCDAARSLAGAARAAYEQGSLLRARRALGKAEALCPREAAAHAELAWRVAGSLGDAQALEAARARLARAADPRLQALATQPLRLYGDDAPDGPPPPDPEAAYRRAARAFLAGAGQFADAGRDAMAVAAASPSLRAEALVLAARSAEASGDGARARRMAARAFLAAFPDIAARPVRAPEDGLLSLAASWPGLRPARPSCVELRDASDPSEVLTPEGAILVRAEGRKLKLRAIPSRVLVDWHDAAGPEGGLLCHGEEGLFRFFHRGFPPETAAGPAGAPLAPLVLPPELRPRPGQAARLGVDPRGDGVLLTRAGALYLAHQGFVDGVAQRQWYLADPGHPALRRLALPTGVLTLAPAPGGDLVGLDGDTRELARFDGRTGKLVKRIGSVPTGSPVLVTSDGRWLHHLARERELHVIDLGTGQTARRATWDRGRLVGLVEDRTALVQDGAAFSAVDIERGGVTPAGVVAGPLRRVDLLASGQRVLAATDDALYTIDLLGGRVARAPLPAGGPAAGDAPAPPPGSLRVERDGADVLLIRTAGGASTTLRLRLARGAAGGMAVDDAGYYELLGDVPEGFRRAAACGPELPLEICADRFEVTGMLVRFAAGDLGYREP